MKKWGNKPISTARLALEVWKVIAQENWVLTSSHLHIGPWARKLWDWDRPDCYGGKDLGAATNIGMSLGVALAYKNTNKLVVDLQTGWGPSLRRICPLDRGSPPHPHAGRDVQQPRLLERLGSPDCA